LSERYLDGDRSARILGRVVCSADRLSNVLYNRLRLAKEIQLNLWVETCLRMTQLGGGRPRDGVHVETRRVDESCLPAPAS
jgi:hypothetical protein